MTEAKLLAMALYQIRVILAPEAVPEASHQVHLAWRLAYALHNDALAIMDGKTFDCEAALTRIANIDRTLGGSDGEAIAEQMRNELLI